MGQQLLGTKHVHVPEVPRLAGRVLVIDDNPVNRLVARRMLASLGLLVDEANSGSQAVAACREVRYDVVLVDWHMPDMTGAEVARELGGLAQPVIIACTADALLDKEQIGPELRIEAILRKPLVRQTLAETLAHWLRKP